jgi:hypothetical protein
MLNSVNPNVFWYGERGIINAVVAHVSTSGDFIGSVRNLLTATHWGKWKSARLGLKISPTPIWV